MLLWIFFVSLESAKLLLPFENVKIFEESKITDEESSRRGGNIYEVSNCYSSIDEILFDLRIVLTMS